MITSDQSSPRAAAVPENWADPTVPSQPASVVGRWAPLAVWFGCLSGAVALLLWLGDGRLATPAVTSPAAWWSWANTDDPLTVTMGALRVLALGLAWYLTGVTSISVVARALRAARLVRIADALSFGPVRTLAQQAVGVSLAAGVLVTSFPVEPAAPRDASVDVAVMIPVEAGTPGAAAAVPAVLALREPAPVPVPAPAGPSAQPQQPAVSQQAPSSAELVAPSEVAEASADTPRERQVRPGEHFWSIAEAEVADHLGRPGSEDEVLDHWEDLVAANADRLQVRGNPDLLLPGQRILLPEVAS